ncbi:MAG TPA: helix-turn-helix domain-containing protein [Candidatus Saccharimonadales bacterium]
MLVEEQVPDSPYVCLKWRALADHAGVHLGVAMEYWTFFFRQEGGKTQVIIGAPHAQMLPLPYQAGGAYWGVLLKAHLFMPLLSKHAIPKEGVQLPVQKGYILIAGQKIPLPSYENTEKFIEDLVHKKIIVANPLVEKALSGTPTFSERTVQRHVLQIAGLTRRELAMIRRARRAFVLLQTGRTIAEVVAEAGYTDQSHLTKSLKLLAGQTPGQILAAYAQQD